MAEDNRRPSTKFPIFDLSDRTKRTKWLLRAVSLALAIILWFFVSWDGSTFRSKELNVPLRYLDIPDGYSVSDRTGSVSVRIEGSLESLALLGRNDVSASISLQDLRPGQYRLPVQINSPQSVRVTRVTPQSVAFDLYRMIERTLRPTVEFEGVVTEGLVIEETVFEPSEVVVKGPEADVVAIRRAVVRVSAGDLQGTVRQEKPVVLMGDAEEIDGLSIEPPAVRVSVRLSDAPEEIRVPVVVPVRGIPGGGLDVDRVIVSPDVVILRGTRNLLANVKEITLNAIDVTGHTDNINVDIPLDSPSPGITIAGTESVKVLVELHSSRETRTFLGVPIVIDGASTDAKWRITPHSANVIVERSVTETEPFDIEKPPVELYVDVTNIVAEQLMLPVLHRGLPSGMRVVRIEPQQVSVTAEN